MQNNMLVGIVLAIIVIGGGFWYVQSMNTGPAVKNDGKEVTDNAAGGTMLEGSEMPDNGMVGGDAEVGSAMPVPRTDTPDTLVVREFTVEGKNFAFAPATMEVKKGETVRVTFKNSTGTHDWVLDEFNARTKVIGSGKEETVEFVADKVGTFEYYCSVGTHRSMGMKGSFVVTE